MFEAIFEAAQAKLPVEDRVAPLDVAMCLAKSKDLLACTKGVEHSGKHIAHGRMGEVLETWE